MNKMRQLRSGVKEHHLETRITLFDWEKKIPVMDWYVDIHVDNFDPFLILHLLQHVGLKE